MSRANHVIITAPVLYAMGLMLGAVAGLVVLIYWYLIVNPGGITGAVIWNVRIHHGVIGLFSLFIGVPFSVSKSPLMRITGGFFTGMGLVVLGEDMFQHCVVTPAAGGGCSSFTFG